MILIPALSAQKQNTPLTVQVPKPSSSAAVGVKFTDVTRAAGLSGFRFVSGTPVKDYIIEAPG
ncbi:MAG: hypothetical protein L0220_02505, partial [Acidobacteria bacterium]|nr:hypothetical protein [Acidobacteriota bacterium]